MDPDENLREQIELSNRMVEADDIDPSDVRRLCELVLALDGWIKRGGFLPAAWKRGRD